MIKILLIALIGFVTASRSLATPADCVKLSENVSAESPFAFDRFDPWAEVFEPGTRSGPSTAITFTQPRMSEMEKSKEQIIAIYDIYVVREYLSDKNLSYNQRLVHSNEEVDWKVYNSPSPEKIENSANRIWEMMMRSASLLKDRRHLSFGPIINSPEPRNKLLQLLLQHEQTPRSKLRREQLRARFDINGLIKPNLTASQPEWTAVGQLLSQLTDQLASFAMEAALYVSETQRGMSAHPTYDQLGPFYWLAEGN